MGTTTHNPWGTLIWIKGAFLGILWSLLLLLFQFLAGNLLSFSPPESLFVINAYFTLCPCIATAIGVTYYSRSLLYDHGPRPATRKTSYALVIASVALTMIAGLAVGVFDLPWYHWFFFIIVNGIVGFLLGPLWIRSHFLFRGIPPRRRY